MRMSLQGAMTSSVTLLISPHRNIIEEHKYNYSVRRPIIIEMRNKYTAAVFMAQCNNEMSMGACAVYARANM